MTTPLLEVDDLVVSFAADEGKVEAVRGASFVVPQHKTVALVGESGSGKTVISQAVLGILPGNARIERGAVNFLHEGKVVDLAPLDQEGGLRRRLRGQHISMIFQEPMSSLSPLHRIGNQIDEVLTLHEGLSDSEAKARTKEMLKLVGFPDADRAYSAYPFELSGGLRQRAVIAMALVCRPELVIADEPTTALDVTVQAQVLKLLKDLQATLGMSILFITHDLGVVANIADEVVVLYRGKVVERGPARELLTDPQHPYLQGLIGAVPSLTTDRSVRLKGLRAINVEHAQAVHRPVPEPGPARGETLLEVQGLNKRFMARKGGPFSGSWLEIVAADDISFTIAKGESFALVGESGSGKTTVSKMIMRGLTPDSGRILFHGPDGPIDVAHLDASALRAFRRRIQYVFQDPYSSLDPRMTVLDIVAEPLLIHGIGNAKERETRARQLLEAVGLDGSRHLRRYPHSFSGGQRQRIGIARALALEPDILLCDEPVSALDVSVQAQVLNLLRDLQKALDLTYLFVAHDLAVVRYIADRIAVMSGGRIVEIAPTDQLFANPRHPYTRNLLAAVPEPDPDRPLDLDHLMAAGNGRPDHWKAPFTIGDKPTRLIEVEPDHYVRMLSESHAPA
ncbi:ABC transporter ATP-binding protein [Geminicoccus roseus]|uniref:ABC transporter ATP-binding protein n=1 Tax=Geminicoccus roseus TaxID=404900 RepID=UPI0003FC3965|nr:ABC transporter ATP-binding protein [Geminicoccus roseus]